MNRILRNAGGTLRLDPATYVRLLHDNYATADAVLIVAAAAAVRLIAVVVLTRFDALDLINGMLQLTISELVRWMVAALILWLVSTKLLKGYGRIPPTVGVAGYAYLPFVFAPIVLIAVELAGLHGLGEIINLVASIWFGLGLRIIARVLFDLPKDRATIAALISVLGWWIVQLIL